MVKKISIIVIIVLLLAGGYELFKTPAQNSSVIPTHAVITKSPVQKDYLTYSGTSGKDALTLLKAKAQVQQDKSGLVISINGRKADNAKHEFWEFDVNGKEAQVGPAQYQTKDTDKIEWKIAKY